MILSAIFYYIASASAVLFYGIGIARTFSVRNELSLEILSFVKALSISTSTVALSYLVSRWLLSPAWLFELFPFITTLIFLAITILIEIFLDVGIKKSPSEFSVTLLTCIISMNESLSVAHAVIIACSCMISFCLFFVLFHSIRGRASFFSDPTGIKIYPTLLLSLAILTLALCGVNATWIMAK